MTTTRNTSRETEGADMKDKCQMVQCSRSAAVLMWNNAADCRFCLQHAKIQRASLATPYFYGMAPVAAMGDRTDAVLAFTGFF